MTTRAVSGGFFVGVALCGVVSVCAFASDLDRMVERHGRMPLATVAGNGRLTVGVDSSGRIAVCRWPTPSYNDHLSYDVDRDSGAPTTPAPGLRWGVRSGDTVQWLDSHDSRPVQGYAEDSPVEMVTRMKAPANGAEYIQTLLVHPTDDVLLIRLTAADSDSVEDVYWQANFTPCTRILPEAPLGDWGALDRTNDFATVIAASPLTVLHFRPQAPSRADHARARQLASERALLRDWGSAFGPGVWIAYTVLDGSGSAIVRDETSVPSGIADETSPQAETSAAYVGRGVSIAKLTPQHESDSVTVLVAFGEDAARATGLLNRYRATSYAETRDTAVAHWRATYARARVPLELDRETRQLLQRCLWLLHTFTDRDTGAGVRSPSTQPSLARDWPRLGATMIHALDLVGYHEIAEKRLGFYAGLVRTERKPGQPAGSLPAAVYTNGRPAAPHTILDSAAAGGFLWASTNHATYVAEERRHDLLTSLWPSVLLAGDFLSRWTDSQRGRPFHSFDPSVGHDRRTRSQLLDTHRALASALAVAEQLEVEPPASWTRRKRDLDVLLQNLFLRGPLNLDLEEPFPLSFSDVPGVNNRRVSELLEQEGLARLEQLTGLEGYAAARALSDLALLWRDNEGYADRLRELLPATLERALVVRGPGGEALPAFPDALSAAHCIIAALTLFDPESSAGAN